MPQIRMKVGGMEYAINSDDSEEYIRSIGAQLDRRLDYLAKQHPFLSTTMVAVLAALEAYDTAGKKEEENEKLRLEIKQLLEESAMAKMTAAMANRRIEELLSERGEPEEEKSPTAVQESEETLEEYPEETEEDYSEEIKESLDDDDSEYKIFQDESGQYGIF